MDGVYPWDVGIGTYKRRRPGRAEANCTLRSDVWSWKSTLQLTCLVKDGGAAYAARQFYSACEHLVLSFIQVSGSRARQA